MSIFLGARGNAAAGSGTLVTTNKFRMSDQNATASFRIEDFVPEHHCSLIEDLGDICSAILANTSCIKLVAFNLQSEVQDMLRRQREAHPDIFAVFERFILMASGGHTMKTELAKQRQQHVFDQLVF